MRSKPLIGVVDCSTSVKLVGAKKKPTEGYRRLRALVNRAIKEAVSAYRVKEDYEERP